MISDKELPLLVNTGKGISVKWKGRFLYSSRDPISGALRRIPSQDLEEYTLYLIPSPLLCYGFKELMEKLPKNSFLLGIERFQELMAAVQPYIPSQLFENNKCQIVRSENGHQILLFIDSLGTYRFRRCRILRLTGGYELDSAFYDNMEDIINHHIFHKWQTKASLMKMGPLWFSNIFKNLNFFSAGISLDRMKIDSPIMLCGAGESLENAISIIKEIRDHIFLVAVDTAYPALLAHEIVPDGVFNLDGQFYNYFDFYKHGNRELFLFSDITAFPASLRLPGVKNIFFSSKFIENQLLKRLTKNSILPTSIPPLGSVGVTSLYLCRKLSQNNLLLTGLDFSYIPGKSHAKGTIYHDLYLMNVKRTCPDGGLIFLSYLRPRHFLKGQLSGKDLRSDKVLEGYYRDFCEILSRENKGIYMIDGDYPSLGVPILDNSAMNHIMKCDVKIIIDPPEFGQLSLKKFIQEEKENLIRVIKEWDKYSENGSSLSLEEALVACDYLTIPLNDDLKDPSFFFQAVKKARYYINLLNRSDNFYEKKS